jgi:hypothetical protein
MSTEVAVFWLVHLFIGLLLPFMMYTGCCRNGEQAQAAPTAKTRR